MSPQPTMRISGVHYYWLVTFGLITGLAFAFATDYLNANISNSPVLAIGALVLIFVAIVAYLVVALEIWERFGLTAAIVAFIIFPLAIVYWLSRINGVKDVSGDT